MGFSAPNLMGGMCDQCDCDVSFMAKSLFHRCGKREQGLHIPSSAYSRDCDFYRHQEL